MNYIWDKEKYNFYLGTKKSNGKIPKGGKTMVIENIKIKTKINLLDRIRLLFKKNKIVYNLEKDGAIGFCRFKTLKNKIFVLNVGQIKEAKQ